MAGKFKITIWVFTSLALVVVALVVIKLSHRHRDISFVIDGSVIQQNSDSRKESPIADVDVSATNGSFVTHAKSDFAGFFKIVWPAGVDPGAAVTLEFTHPDYKSIEMRSLPGEKLYVIRMIPIHGEVEAALNQAEMSLSSVMIRYSTEMSSTDNIGTGVKTFQVVNTGNVPCDQHYPCSPDGKWKAAIDSASLDAGEGNVFEDARVSCIAGPCPFTKIEYDGFSKPARNIKVSIRNWSDTTTFLLQAEVFHTRMLDTVRKSYPVIFGRSLNFTLPADARGPAIEADLDNTPVVFVLAPSPSLSWADCRVRVESNNTKDYRCELKPGYQFK